jgi:hypothetical protein
MATKLVIVDDSANEILRGAVECPEVVTNVLVHFLLFGASCNPEGGIGLPEVNDSCSHLGIEMNKQAWIYACDLKLFIPEFNFFHKIDQAVGPKDSRMSSIAEHIMALWSKSPSPQFTCRYEERIKCFQKLAEIQKNLKSADKEYLTVSSTEGTAHENALKRMELYTSQYKKEYELCEIIMKYK